MKTTLFLIFTLSATSLFAANSNEKQERIDEIIQENKTKVIGNTSDRFQKVLIEVYNGDLDLMQQDLRAKANQMHEECREEKLAHQCYVKKSESLSIRPKDMDIELESALRRVEDPTIKEQLADLDNELKTFNNQEERLRNFDMERAQEMLDNQAFDQY